MRVVVRLGQCHISPTAGRVVWVSAGMWSNWQVSVVKVWAWDSGGKFDATDGTWGPWGHGVYGDMGTIGTCGTTGTWLLGRLSLDLSRVSIYGHANSEGEDGDLTIVISHIMFCHDMNDVTRQSAGDEYVASNFARVAWEGLMLLCACFV